MLWDHSVVSPSVFIVLCVLVLIPGGGGDGGGDGGGSRTVLLRRCGECSSVKIPTLHIEIGIDSPSQSNSRPSFACHHKTS